MSKVKRALGIAEQALGVANNTATYFAVGQTGNLLDPSKNVSAKEPYTYGTHTINDYLMSATGWTTFNIINVNAGDILYLMQGTTKIAGYYNTFAIDGTMITRNIVSNIYGVTISEGASFIAIGTNAVINGTEQIKRSTANLTIFESYGYTSNVYKKPDIDGMIQALTINTNKSTLSNYNVLPLGNKLETTSTTCITTGLAGTFDAGKIESPFIWWDSNLLKYGMTYTGYRFKVDGVTLDYACIGLAWSDDLITWVKETNPLLTPSGIAGEPDFGSVTGSSIFMENGIYYLFYCGCSLAGYEQGDKQICVASGEDLYTLIRYANNPIIPLPGWDAQNWYTNAIYDTFVLKWTDDLYYLFSNGCGKLDKTINITKERIGYATSTDLFHWTVNPIHVIDVSVSGFDSQIAGDPNLYDIGDENIYMAYYGFDGTVCSDGIAYTKKTNFPTGWQKYSGNPITTNWQAKPSIIYRNGVQYHFYGMSGSAIGVIKSV